MVHVLRGKSLLPMDANGLSDPFVEFYTSNKPNEKQFTHVIEKSLNPEWLSRRKINLKAPVGPPVKVLPIYHSSSTSESGTETHVDRTSLATWKWISLLS